MLEGLNDQQREAIIQPGHVLLTACPGSGKTRVLTYKIGTELKKVEDTKKIIIALTFTNRAADEIKSRISKMNIEPKEQLWAGTIHAFCLEWILRPYRGYLPELKNGFIIADEYRSEEIMNSVKDANNMNRRAYISTKINSNGTLAETRNPAIVSEYHEKLRELGLIDFDQMLYLSYKLLDSYPKISKTLNNLFHLICVDEYQDTQELQYSILSKIYRVQNSKTSLFIVGDKDQAIYGSLGGVAKSLTEIKSLFGNIEMTEKELSGNYRSSQRIIDYYRNFQTTSLEIESLAPYADFSGIINFSNQEVTPTDLPQHIANIIQRHIDNGVPESEICVLAPQWWLVIQMGRSLKKLLPSLNFDAPGLSPLTKSYENTWYKFARLFLVPPHPNNHVVRSRWADELLFELDTIGLVLFPEDERKSRSLLRIINSINSNNVNGLNYLEDCFQQFLDHVAISLTDYPQLKLHWDSFFDGARRKIERDEHADDTESFRSYFSHKKGIVVNTCHGIKGEEFEVVIGFGLLNGYIPNRGEIDPVNASNKLLYVICSRAKKYLHLFSEKDRLLARAICPTNTQLNELSFDYDD